MNQKEESQKNLLLFLLLVLIIGLSSWLIYSLYGYTRTPSSTKTNKIINNKKKEEPKKEKSKKEEKDELQELVDKMMIPFTEYNGYVITDKYNNYFFTESNYTYETISDEQKVAIAIILYQETIDDNSTIPTYQIRKLIKEYFGKELATNLPEKVIMQHTNETYELDGSNYVTNGDYEALSELTDRIQQKIVKKELINDELIVTINFVFISYKLGSTYEIPETISSNIYTDINKERTLMIDVDYDKEETVVNSLLEGDKTYTYKYYFKKGTDNKYTFEKIVLEK